MKIGDKVTIKRGKLNGQVGEVKIANGDKVVLEMADGSLEIQNATNIRQPVEATITQDELAAILNSVALTASGDLDALVHSIDAKYPGFATRINVYAKAEEA